MPFHDETLTAILNLFSTWLFVSTTMQFSFWYGTAQLQFNTHMWVTDARPE